MESAATPSPEELSPEPPPARRWPAAVVAAGAILAAVILAAVGYYREHPGPSNGPGAAPAVQPSNPPPTTDPISPGDSFPPLQVKGWVHGPPPAMNAPGVRLTVVDVWASWCPYCREAAPGLVRVYHKYADRGVSFVSVTNMPEVTASIFSREFGAPWPSGYDLSPDGIAALRANSGMPTPGYEIAPTVYLVGPDGRIRWSDRGRFRHTNAGDWERALDAAVAAALDDPARGKP